MERPFVRVSLVGIEILKIDVRVVVASVDTYLRFAEACNRLDLESGRKAPSQLTDLVSDMTENGAKGKSKGAGEATKRAGRTAIEGVESGRQAVVSATGKAASTVATTWALAKHRKAVAAGATAGLVGVVGIAFTAGRRTAKLKGGPLTRLTHGHI